MPRVFPRSCAALLSATASGCNARLELPLSGNAVVRVVSGLTVRWCPTTREDILAGCRRLVAAGPGPERAESGPLALSESYHGGKYLREGVVRSANDRGEATPLTKQIQLYQRWSRVQTSNPAVYCGVEPRGHQHRFHNIQWYDPRIVSCVTLDEGEFDR